MPTETTTTMKAIQIKSYGGPEVAEYTEVARPQPGEGELLIKVFATAVNPVDWMTVRGYLDGAVKLPVIPGWDVAGTVEALGTGVKGFAAGEPVYAMIHVRGGAYAEYALVKQEEVARKPANLDYQQAASVPLVALTAWQALFDAAKLAPGQTVLVHAAAGGVGSMAVQLAHNAGARVIGTASAKNAEFVRGLGADEVIDYTTTRFEEAVQGVDVVLDTVGGETLDRSYGVLKPGGILLSLVAQPDQARAEVAGIRALQYSVHPNAAQLQQIAELLEAGQLKTEVSQVLPITEAGRALAQSEARHIRGKLVLKIAE
ncbi:MAG TPA: NADP-dependent oxidoreductase [Chloroflexia bacterium]|nr:NADP-dependent oxidoreductase [Chloroflexia bacterium]